MQPRPRRLQTLPPDGLILEEVISGMQGEYGIPATPQEYRLLLRLATEQTAEPPPAPGPGSKAREGAPPPLMSNRSSRRRRGVRAQSEPSEDIEEVNGEGSGSPNTEV